MYLEKSVVIDVIKKSKFKGSYSNTLVDAFVRCVNDKGDLYKVDTPERLAAFVGQCVHESMGFQFFGEYGYQKDAQKRETVRRSFKYYPYYGRGPIQTTLEANYKVVSKEIYGDSNTLVNNPSLLDDPYLSVWGSLVWWANSKAPAAAQKMDFNNVSKIVNKYDSKTFAARKQISSDTVNVFKTKIFEVKFKGDPTPKKTSFWNYLNILKNWNNS